MSIMLSSNYIKLLLIVQLILLTALSFGSFTHPQFSQTSCIDKVEPTDTTKLKTLLLKILYQDQKINPSSINKLLKKNSLVSLENSFENSIYYSKPIDILTRNYMNEQFLESYKSVNKTISSPQLKVHWHILQQYIDIHNLEHNGDTGVGIYYIIDFNPDSSLKFSYVIAKSYRNSITSEINPIPYNDSFLMLTTTLPYYKKISLNEFTHKKHLYKINTTVRKVTTDPPYTYNIASLIHPTVCFHRGDSVYSFYKTNYLSSLDSSKLYIILEHGASPEKTIFDNNGNKYELSLHSPIILFEYMGKVLINDLFNSAKPYENKGLDVGRLCPPDC